MKTIVTIIGALAFIGVIALLWWVYYVVLVCQEPQQNFFHLPDWVYNKL